MKPPATPNAVLLFTYGLLRTGHSGYRGLKLDRKARSLGRDRLHGRLYHLGHYPGMKMGRHGLVHGELFEITDPSALADIDAYELCDPDRPHVSEYRRLEVTLLDSGKRAWVYEYNRPIKNRPIIATGTWSVR